MNKKKLGVVFASLTLLLSGCGNATTQIQNSKDELIKVGDYSFTKGMIYNSLVAQANINPIVNRMNQILVDEYVPITEEIKKAAETTLASYKESYGDDWEKTYKNAGYATEEDFFNNVILLNERASKLTRIYLEKDFNDVIKTYNPRKVEIIEMKEIAKAEEALAAAKKDKSNFVEIAKQFGDTTTFDGNIKVYHSYSELPAVVWNNILKVDKDNTVIDKVLQDSTAAKFYIVRVTSVNPKQFKEEAVSAMTTIKIDTSVKDENGVVPLSLDELAFQYLIHTLDYSIHDVIIYQNLLSSSRKFER